MRPPINNENTAPVLQIPAPPMNELGDAVSARWTTYFRWLVTGHYSCIHVYRCRSRGGFNQALRRYKLELQADLKSNPSPSVKTAVKAAEKIGIIMMLKDDGTGRPDHWEIRVQKSANEQRQAMTDKHFVAWRRATMTALLDTCTAKLDAPIEADALQWWLYSKFYNILSRKKKAAPTAKESKAENKLKHALDAKFLTSPDHWNLVETSDGLALRISDALREAIRISNA